MILESEKFLNFSRLFDRLRKRRQAKNSSKFPTY